MNDRVNVLGTEYAIVYAKEKNDQKLKRMDAYCDQTAKKIVVEKFKRDGDTVGDLDCYRKECLRHEIVHAFLFESGLAGSSGECRAWAKNEEMVDWIAKQFPKMQKAFEEAGAL
jgi:hypothetical protein